MSAPTALVLAEAPADCDVRALVRPVLVLPTDDPAVVIWPCSRCWEEDGKIAMYSHVADGVCFKCGGMGGAEMARDAAERKAAKLITGRIARARKAERERLAMLAARAATQAALVAEHPVLAVLLDEAASGTERPAEPGEDPDGYGYGEDWAEIPVVRVAPLGETVHAIAEDFRYRPERFSAKRIASVVGVIERAQARVAAHAAKVAEIAAAAVEIPTGRVEIRGRVVASWISEVQAGYQMTTVVKIRVEVTEGWVAIGTAPAAILDALYAEGTEGYGIDLIKGREVAFTARVEPAREQREGELPVGFYSRPTKARLV